MSLSIPLPVLVLCLVVAVVLLATSFRSKKLKNDSSRNAKHIEAHTNGHESADKKIQVPVLFGTQTNTAECFARKLATELNAKFGSELQAIAVDLEDYEEVTKLSHEKFVLFCVATYGDGEPTSNAERFVEWLRRTSVDLSKVNYSVFGLGNRQYEHFNSCGREVDRRMAELGALRLADIGLGDDDGDIEADFDSWRPKLYAEMISGKLSFISSCSIDSLDEMQPPNSLYQIDVLLRGKAVPSSLNGTGREQSSPLLASISKIEEMHSKDSGRSCLHIEIELGASGLQYEAGDHVGIFAENCREDVELACKFLGMPSDSLILMKKRKDEQGAKSPPHSVPITLGDAIAKYADVLNPPKRDSLLKLASHASNQDEKDRLYLLASSAGREEYESYILSQNRSLLEVLQAFNSVSPLPLDSFFGVVAPILQPRYYSISSSPLLHPTQIHVTAAVVEGKTPTGRIHKGVCTSYLSRAEPGVTKLPIFVRRSTFKLPKISDSNGTTTVNGHVGKESKGAYLSPPIIMIGPGTGLAPFRGFMQERCMTMRGSKLEDRKLRLGPAELYFGCRSQKADFIYKSELEKFVSEGVIDNLYVAFSRDQKEKVYVQHKMIDNKYSTWDKIVNGGIVYVCGDARHMAKDVNRTLHRMAMDCGGMTGSEAELFFESMHKQGRYMQDVW